MIRSTTILAKYERERDQQSRRLDHRQIARRDAVIEQRSESRPCKDDFRQQRPAEQVSKLQAGDGDDRRQGVQDDMSAYERGSGQSLGSGDAHMRSPQRLDHG